MVKELKEEGKDFKEMQKILGIHEYRIKKAIPYSNRYSINQLYNILSKAYRVDHNIKKGILDGRLALELLIAEI
jgi:DNA polymerase-3 subunit delta